jgi:hypothetical protein
MAEKPNAFAGRRLEIVGLITATKEGAFVWDSACRNRGIPLLFAKTAQEQSDILELGRAMRNHGLSDHPIAARLRGTLLIDWGDKVRQTTYTAFEVDGATDIEQSPTVQRPSGP